MKNVSLGGQCLWIYTTNCEVLGGNFQRKMVV